MAKIKTQDNQKVFNSATAKLQSFLGAVENPSSSKNMELIYGNMEKLFETFTRGVLLEQGANSEILLRTVYRSLSEDFLKIIQDTKAVDKIAEVIKSRQDSIKPEEVATAMVSETTKKVITKTLDPNDLDPMSVILDFTDELQTAILQVKLNLSREYERQKLAHAKSLSGQQEDIDRLNEGFQEQDQLMADTLQEMQETGSEWKDDKLKELEDLLNVFSGLDSTGFNDKLSMLESSVTSNKDFNELLSGKSKKPAFSFTANKVVDGLKGVQTTSSSSKLKKKEALKPSPSVTPLTKKNVKDVSTKKVEKQSQELKKQVDKIQPRHESIPPIEVQEKTSDAEPQVQRTPETPQPVQPSQIETEYAPKNQVQHEVERQTPVPVIQPMKVVVTKLVQPSTPEIPDIVQIQNEKFAPIGTLPGKVLAEKKPVEDNTIRQPTKQRHVLGKQSSVVLKNRVFDKTRSSRLLVSPKMPLLANRSAVSRPVVPKSIPKVGVKPTAKVVAPPFAKKGWKKTFPKIQVNPVKRLVLRSKPKKAKFSELDMEKQPLVGKKTSVEKRQFWKPVSSKKSKVLGKSKKKGKLKNPKDSVKEIGTKILGDGFLGDKKLKNARKGLAGGKKGGKAKKVGKGKIAASPMMQPLAGRKSATPQTKGTKLGQKPHGKYCTCPICGDVHLSKKANLKGGAKPNKNDTKKQKQTKTPPEEGNKQQDNGNDISTDNVKSTLGTIGGNIKNLVNNKKFKNNFQLKYGKIQETVKSQMQKMDSDEETISNDLDKTKAGIKKIKKGKKGNLILSMLKLGNLFTLSFMILGGLILVALIRKGWQMWKEAYMPKVHSDPVQYKIFGFTIPISGQIIDLCIGIRNFVVVGLPNWFAKAKKILGDVYETLFGKKGCMRDFAEMRRTWKRLVAAWIVGNTKKAVGWIGTILGEILSFIPLVGPVLRWICKLLPEIYAFVTNLLMKKKTQEEAQQYREQKIDKSLLKSRQKNLYNKYSGIVNQIIDSSSKVKPMAPPEAIPHLQTPRTRFNVRKPAAIMRYVAIQQNHNTKENLSNLEGFKQGEKEVKKTIGRYIDTANGNIAAGKGGWHTRAPTKMKGWKNGDYGAEGTYHLWINGAMSAENSNERSRIVSALGLGSDPGASLFDRLITLSQRDWSELGGTKAKRAYAYKLIDGEIKQYDEYMKYLDKAWKDKEKDNGVPLYDIDKGWNPNFAIYQKDLASRIPFTPFTEMTSQPKFTLGTPAGPEKEDGGYPKGMMPYKWFYNGNVVYRNPYEFEYERARRARRAWTMLADIVSGPTRFWNSDKPIDFKTLQAALLMDYKFFNQDVVLNGEHFDYIFFGDWLAANIPTSNSIYTAKGNGSWEAGVLADQGFFPWYWHKVRDGYIDDENNNINTVLFALHAKGRHWWRGTDKNGKRMTRRTSRVDRTWDPIHIGLSEHNIGHGFSKEEVEAWERGEAVGGVLLKKYGDDSDMWSGDVNKWNRHYSKGPGDFKWKEGTLELVQDEAKKYMMGKQGWQSTPEADKDAYNRFLEHLNTSVIVGYLPTKYKQYRDLVFGAGFGLLFGSKKGRITNPIKKAESIIGRLVWDLQTIMPAKDQTTDKNDVYKGLWESLLDYMNIKGYDYNQFSTDAGARMGMAQLVLDYFSRVYGLWGPLDKALANSMINPSADNKSKFTKSLYTFAKWFDQEKILGFLATHIRFPNMKLNVIDYDNARNDEDLSKLDLYRIKLGFLTKQEKSYLLQGYHKDYEEIKESLVKFQDKPEFMERIRNRIEKWLNHLSNTYMKKAEQEYKYTGDSTFIDSLTDVYEAGKQLSDLTYTPGAINTKITPTATGFVKVVNPIIDPKVRSERRKKQEEEKKRMENERKRREAVERRKKLAEEAARRQQLAILEAKTKIIEEIKLHEQNYQTILAKFVEGQKVDESDLKALGDDVKKVKQEAEKKIAEMPRQDRELRLALIRGDKISDKTFTEMKITASGLHLGLQEYISEVNKIPTCSLVEIQGIPTGKPTVVNQQEPESVDLAS